MSARQQPELSDHGGLAACFPIPAQTQRRLLRGLVAALALLPCLVRRCFGRLGFLRAAFAFLRARRSGVTFNLYAWNRVARPCSPATLSASEG